MDDQPHRPSVALGPATRLTAWPEPHLPAPDTPGRATEPAATRRRGSGSEAPPVEDAGEQAIAAALAEWEGEGGHVLRPAPRPFVRLSRPGTPQPLHP